MTELKEISIHIMLEVVDAKPPQCPPHSSDKHFQCDLFSMCNDLHCFSAGCQNVVTKQASEVKS